MHSLVLHLPSSAMLGGLPPSLAAARLPPPAPPRPGDSQPPESESQVIVVYGDTCAAATHGRPSPAITLLFGRVIAGVLAKNGSSSGHEPLVPLFSCRPHSEAPCYCGVRHSAPFLRAPPGIFLLRRRSSHHILHSRQVTQSPYFPVAFK